MLERRLKILMQVKEDNVCLLKMLNIYSSVIVDYFFWQQCTACLVAKYKCKGKIRVSELRKFQSLKLLYFPVVQQLLSSTEPV